MTTSQRPIPSGFTAASTTSDVLKDIDLTGKTAIVTGGYSGLGLETVRALRAAGAHIIIPARDLKRAMSAVAGLDGVEVWPMDLLDPVSINAFAERFVNSDQALHILVNSAGIMAVPELTLDSRGYELHFATNHLGHFQLTTRLWPALKKAGGARVVSVSSWGHHFSPVVFDDINYLHRSYDPWTAYGQSKTANVLFAVALDARGQANGVRAFAVHPGSIAGTGLERYVALEALKAAGVIDENGYPIIDPARNLKTVEQGASTGVWCATSPQLNGMGAVYCENTDIATVDTADPSQSPEIGDSLKQNGVMPYAIDPATANKLWTLSEQMLGLVNASAAG